MKERALRWLGPVLVALAGGAALVRGWGVGPDPIVDFGRELYVPWRLLEGDVLYRDIAYIHGPISPHLNALWFGIGGVGLDTLLVANAAVAALLTALLYRLLALAGGRFAATLACLFFAGGFAFVHASERALYDFLTPYSHETVHGLLFGVLALSALSLRPRHGHIALAAAGLAAGCGLLTKPETAFAVAGASGLGVLASLLAHRSPPPAWLREVGVFGAAAALPPLLAWLGLGLQLGGAAALGHLLKPTLSVLDPEIASLEFYARIRGTHDLAGSLTEVMRWCGVQLAVFAPMAFAGARLGAGGPRWQGYAAIAVGVVAMLAFGRLPPEAWPETSRALTLVLPLLALVSGAELLRARREGADPERSVLRFSLVAFALLLLPKVAFNAQLEHYGFSLAAIGTLLWVSALAGWLPERIESRGGSGTPLRAATLVAVVAACLGFVALGDAARERYVHPLGDGRDAFLSSPSAIRVGRLLEGIDRLLAPGDTLAVLPEGVMVNYLSRRANPAAHINFMPPEILMFGEQEIIRSFAEQPPDYIAVVHKDTREYGLPLFGTDYAQDLYAWVRDAYRPVLRLDAAPLVRIDAFGIELLQRGEAPEEGSSSSTIDGVRTTMRPRLRR